MPVFERTHRLPFPLEEVFPFFAEPANLERLTPGWMRFRLLEAPARVERGARMRYRMAPLGIPTTWVAEISRWEPPFAFADVQLRGPYREWEHTHSFAERAGGTEISDRIVYRLPGGRLGALADPLGHRAMLSRMFDYRSKRLTELLGAGSGV
jgi:ligand-binding SRPBCC domain-containing protein